MKKKFRAMGLVFFSAGLFLVNLQAAEFYIDGATGNDANPGTLAQPWRTIQKANQTLQPGDKVFIRGGVYSNQIIQPSNSGISESQRIEYHAYPGEQVEIRDSAYGIYLFKKSYITVSNMRFFSLRRFLRIYAGHYNVIGHCVFDTRSPASGDWAGGRIANDYTDSSPNSEPSTYNRVHDCVFIRWSYGGFAEHRGALLDIGNNMNANDHSSFNLIEGNTFAYGGHHTLGVYAPYNVIRRNYFHNETNPENWPHEGYRASITEGPNAGRCLYEGNRYGHAGASGMALRSPRNVFRFNVFYHNGSGGIQVVSNAANDYADQNRIYHNTFYHNGHLATYQGFQGGMYFANWSNRSPIGNVVKNNLFFDNKNGAVSYSGSIQPQVIESNWDQNNQNPGLRDLTDGGPQNSTLPDLRLTAGSEAIDQASFLATIVSPTATGTTIQVSDASYFMDGWGIPGVSGDLLRLQQSGQRARIVNIDYQTNTLTLDTSLSWTQGQGISLDYEGAAPDFGAHEYNPGAGTQTIVLNSGWNWVSFNVLPGDRSLDAVFGGILGQVEQVRTQNQSAMRVGGSWMGDLGNMDGIQQGRMYKIRVNANCSLTVTGTQIAANTPISLANGWNWAAYYPSSALAIGSALASITGQVQQARWQTQSALFNGSTWTGDLTQLEPGKGYTIRVSGPATLTYPGGQ